MDDVEKKRKALLARVYWDSFYRCPNNGSIIPKLPGDDKVLCTCGKVNPSWPTEYPGCHVASLLESATSEEFVEYEEKLWSEKKGKA